MFFFGHIGVGAGLVRPWKARLPFRPLALGTILPDLVDKSLYYGMSWSTGRHGAALGLISCTRTFGHTGLFLATLGLAGWRLRSTRLMAVAVGAATHVLLDNVPALYSKVMTSATIAFLYPFYLHHFGIMETSGLADHLRSLFVDPYIIVSEIIGLYLLSWLWRHDRAWLKPEIVEG